MKLRYFLGTLSGLLILLAVFFFPFTFSKVSDSGVNFIYSLQSSVDKWESPEGSANIAEAKETEAPDIIKAVYLTSWSASRKSKIDYVINLAKTTGINAVVIDIKDYSGYVFYDSKIPAVVEYGAKKKRLSDVSSLINELHKENIYVIARIVVFQDPVLAQNRHDLAIYQKDSISFFFSRFLASISLWLDNLKLAWVDPASEEVWNYNIDIAKEALELGFDEINFDYVRFPSDGDFKAINYPIWDGKTPRNLVIKNFFKKVRESLPQTKLSVDLFGYTTTNYDDLGVGQIIENAFEYFDYVCPMVYPSHYADGFLGFEKPAEYPYEVVKHSMESASVRLNTYKKNFETEDKKINVKIRPWLQDFNLRGVAYDSKMVESEIKAVSDGLGKEFYGFMLWNPSNLYTKEALKNYKIPETEEDKELKDKIGQMIMAGFRGTEAPSGSYVEKIVKDLKLGGVVLFDYDNPSKSFPRNIINTKQTKKLISDLKSYSSIPLLISVDAEGGSVNRLKEEYGFSKILSAKEMAQGGTVLTITESHKLAVELKDLGFNMNFAPVVDVNVNPDNPIIGALNRSFSSDPERVAEYAEAFIKEHNKLNIITIEKHFPGHGSSTSDSHLGVVDITNTYQNKELIPYKELQKKGLLDVVMTAHIMNRSIDKDYSATLSSEFLQKILREQIGFEGVIISDDMQMNAIVDNYGFEDAIIKAVNAGCDIILISNNGALKYDEQLPYKTRDIIYEAVKSNKISKEKILESYNRIYNLKKKFGII